MTVLVDEACWKWRGLRWAHLASDESHDELHAFAARLGVRRISFQGDHYDVPETLRAIALSQGAVPVTSRELVTRLRRSGLRTRTPPAPWTRVWYREAPARFDGRSADRAISELGLSGHPARDWIAALATGAPRLADQGAMALVRGSERALTLDLPPVEAESLDLAVRGDPVVVHRARRAASIGLEVVWMV